MLDDPEFAVFADMQTPSGTASMLGDTAIDGAAIQSQVLNSTVIDGGSQADASQTPNFSVISPHYLYC